VARPTAPPLDRDPALPLVIGLVAGGVARLLSRTTSSNTPVGNARQGVRHSVAAR
jgi:hypothetical protein